MAEIKIRNKARKLTEEEVAQIAGGFQFDSNYFIHKSELNLKCPVCGAEGTLESAGVGWYGYGNGTRVAVDNSICSNCGAQVDIEPELGEMVVVHFNPETMEYSEDVYPLQW